MNLHHDPFAVFEQSRTPCGLYARRRWRGEGETEEFRRDFAAAVDTILADQSPDGHWDYSVLRTARHLFDLHLTVRDRTDPADRALDWLTGQAEDLFVRNRTRSEPSVSPIDLGPLPFVGSRNDVFVTSAALFLETVMGGGDRPRTLALYGRLAAECLDNPRWQADPAALTNILRALAVHPRYREDAAARLIVEKLAEAQGPDGDWGGRFPPYLTVNALAHLRLPEVEPPLTAAFARIQETQAEDGTWGEAHPEWATFLVVHALIQRGHLTPPALQPA